MDEMVRDIRGEMDVILKNIQWMDDKTRVRAREKLRTMKEYIGYPDELLQVHLLEEVYKASTFNSSRNPYLPSNTDRTFTSGPGGVSSEAF